MRGDNCTYAGVEGVHDLRSGDLGHKSGKNMMLRFSALTMYIALFLLLHNRVPLNRATPGIYNFWNTLCKSSHILVSTKIPVAVQTLKTVRVPNVMMHLVHESYSKNLRMPVTFSCFREQ